MTLLITQFNQKNMMISYDLHIDVDNFLFSPLSKNRQCRWSGFRRCWKVRSFPTNVPFLLSFICAGKRLSSAFCSYEMIPNVEQGSCRTNAPDFLA